MRNKTKIVIWDFMPFDYKAAEEYLEIVPKHYYSTENWEVFL